MCVSISKVWKHPASLWPPTPTPAASRVLEAKRGSLRLVELTKRSLFPFKETAVLSHASLKTGSSPLFAKDAVITSPKCSQVFPQLERDIAFDQVAFDCSPEDTCELGHTELLARSGQTMRRKMQFYIPIYYPMTSIVRRIVCIYSFAGTVLSISVYIKLHRFAYL